MILDDGTESMDQTDISNKWREEFESLFSENLSFDNSDVDFFNLAKLNLQSYSELDRDTHIALQILQYLICCDTSRSLTPLPCRVVNHCHVVQVLDRTEC